MNHQRRSSRCGTKKSTGSNGASDPAWTFSCFAQGLLCLLDAQDLQTDCVRIGSLRFDPIQNLARLKYRSEGSEDPGLPIRQVARVPRVGQPGDLQLRLKRKAQLSFPPKAARIAAARPIPPGFLGPLS